MSRGISALRYHLVHLPAYTRQHLPRAMKKVKDIRVQCTFIYLGYLSNVMLMVALGIGLYTEWFYTDNTAILLISLFGLLVFAVSCALQYYFDFQNVGLALMHTWLGCILGVLVFTVQQLEFENKIMEQAMNILFLASMGFSWFWSLCTRCLHYVKHEAVIFCPVECYETLGIMIAAFVTGGNTIPIILLSVAFLMNLIAIRMKSLIGVMSLISMLVISVFVFFPSISVSVNFYGLACFVGRHSFEPVVDLYFSGLSTLERWQNFFNKSKILRHLTVMLIFCLNLVLGALIGAQSTNHKEWFVVIPIYVVFAIIWLCFHVIYFITSWKLMSKITECNLTYSGITDERKSMNRIMASKGVRHFGLISQRLICITVLTTIILAAIGWETKTGYSLALAMVIVPLEGVTLSLFLELGNFLGGTCVGFALIAPVTLQRASGGAKLLSTTAVQEIGSRATATLSKIQQFFSFHMIENFGCDYSTSGVNREYLESKLKSFFDRRTSDGPRYDTYILYYSGDVYETGDWALADNKNLKLDTLLEWWSLKNAQSGARLILVLDTAHSYAWAKDVQYVRDEFVAIQTCRFVKPPDPEYGEKCQVGTFTQDWVHFNLDGDLDLPWSDKERMVKALYKVSRYWTSFTFHLPTSDDIVEHWESNFPKFTKPLIKAVNFRGGGGICCCLDCVSRCLKRKRMSWLPPKEVDTGHGFKLVKS